MPTVDLRAEPLRALNRALHALRPDTNETRWTVVNPDGRHAIAAGLDAPIHVEIEVTEIKPTSKNPMRALVRTTNVVKNQKGETVLVYTPLRMMQGR